MTVQTIKVDITPGAPAPILHCSQGDIGRSFHVEVYDGAEPYDIPENASVELIGRKADKKIFQDNNNLVVKGYTITIVSFEQMTAVAGPVVCELRFKYTNDLIATANFILMCEGGILDGSFSASDLDIIRHAEAIIGDIDNLTEQASDYAVAAAQSASNASQSASDASSSASDANDSKTAAAQSAYAADRSAANAESYANSARESARAVGSTYNNIVTLSLEAAQSASDASQSASNAAQSASDANDSKTAAAQSASEAAQSASDAADSVADVNAAKTAAQAAQTAAEAAAQSVLNMTVSAQSVDASQSASVQKTTQNDVVNLAFFIPRGAQGPKGEDGVGIPTGGQTGQVLKKASNANYDYTWVDEGSTAPQVWIDGNAFKNLSSLILDDYTITMVSNPNCNRLTLSNNTVVANMRFDVKYNATNPSTLGSRINDDFTSDFTALIVGEFPSECSPRSLYNFTSISLAAPAIVRYEAYRDNDNLVRHATANALCVIDSVFNQFRIVAIDDIVFNNISNPTLTVYANMTWSTAY